MQAYNYWQDQPGNYFVGMETSFQWRKDAHKPHSWIAFSAVPKNNAEERFQIFV
jgi:hypothetical protein